MSMSKKDFVALADHIKSANLQSGERWTGKFGPDHVLTLANFCASQNPAFNRARWLAYIAGECGPGGRKVKGGKQ